MPYKDPDKRRQQDALRKKLKRNGITSVTAGQISRRVESELERKLLKSINPEAAVIQEVTEKRLKKLAEKAQNSQNLPEKSEDLDKISKHVSKRIEAELNVEETYGWRRFLRDLDEKVKSGGLNESQAMNSRQIELGRRMQDAAARSLDDLDGECAAAKFQAISKMARDGAVIERAARGSEGDQGRDDTVDKKMAVLNEKMMSDPDKLKLLHDLMVDRN